MGYEAAIPPVPNRKEELQLISGIQKSFNEQPWYKFYMNEGLRLRKIEHGENMNNYKRAFWSNFFRACIISNILLAPITFLYRKTGAGVPLFFQPKHFFSVIKDGRAHTFRTYKMIRFHIPMTIFLGLFYARLRTNIEPVYDEYYDNKSVILPK